MTTGATDEPPVRQRAARVPAEQRRAEILQAALDVFGTRGYHKASLAEIAERVGITHQGILHHFGSKEQLLVEVLEYRDARDVESFVDHAPPRGAALMQHLADTARTNMSRVGLVQSYAVLSAESVTDGHPAQDSFRDRFTTLRAMIAEAFAEAAPYGRRPTEVEVDTAASSVIAVMDGLQVQWLLDPERVDMPSAVSLVIDSLLARFEIDSRTGASDSPTRGSDSPTGGSDSPTHGSDSPTHGSDSRTGGSDSPTGAGATRGSMGSSSPRGKA